MDGDGSWVVRQPQNFAYKCLHAHVDFLTAVLTLAGLHIAKSLHEHFAGYLDFEEAISVVVR